MSFTFSWPHAAKEVFVTGTFDNWRKSVKLDPTASGHEKTVPLPKTNEKVLYKFVADGDWKHDHTGKTETDHEGNVNNVLYPEDIKHASAAESTISSVAPGASTTAMAGSQPLEKEETRSSVPGAFPETPAVTSEDKDFSVNPIPASEGAGNPINLAPGETVPEPSSINSNTLTSQVHDDPSLKSSAEESEQTFGVAPIPATGGIGNPVHLEPGEKVPDASTITGNTTTSNVRLDKESYEKSDAGAPVLPAPLSPQSEREAAGASIFGAGSLGGLGPQTSNMIPESSMGMGKDAPAPMDAGPTISSVAPTSTTNELAGAQPLEQTRSVPSVVSESQEAAGVDPEASANPRALEEKDEVENELHSKVPEMPATTESGVLGKSENNKDIAGMAMEGVAAAGATAAAGAYALRGKVHETTGTDPVSVLPQSAQDTINKNDTQSKTLEPQSTTSEGAVPPVVTESQEAAHVDPEASANPRALEEKSEVENELQSKVPEVPATSESGMLGKSENKDITGMAAGGVAAAGATAAAGAFALRGRVQESTGRDPVSVLPQSVQDSINSMNTHVEKNEPISQEAPKPALSSMASLPQQTAVGEPVRVPSETDNARDTATSVPDEVITSQKEAHADPEAAADPTAVQEKSEVEKELMSKVPESEAAGEPAPATSAALSSTAPTTTTTTSTEKTASGAPQLGNPVSGVAPLSMDKPAESSTTASGGLNAPASEPAIPPTQQTLAAPEYEPMDSRDVSPMTRPPGGTISQQTQPTVTTGPETSKAPVESKPSTTAGAPVGTPRKPQQPFSESSKRGSFFGGKQDKGTPESQRTVDSAASATGSSSGKEKKKGFFGRLKEKMK